MTIASDLVVKCRDAVMRMQRGIPQVTETDDLLAQAADVIHDLLTKRIRITALTSE